jgi:uncharacterized protein YlaN (UPF0358 family)
MISQKHNERLHIFSFFAILKINGKKNDFLLNNARIDKEKVAIPMNEIKAQALQLLKAEADKIEHLIEVQRSNLTMPKCPLYEEVLDTQLFGLSRVIDFLTRLDLLSKEEGKDILDELEKRVSAKIGQ